MEVVKRLEEFINLIAESAAELEGWDRVAGDLVSAARAREKGLDQEVWDRGLD